VKIEQTDDGKHYVAGLGLSMENTEEGKQSQFLVAANRIAFIDPANGNETPMFVAQGDPVFMNDVFMKYLSSPTITSGGNPPAFSLSPEGILTAKNATVRGNITATSGTLDNVTINQNCLIQGKLSVNQLEGDIVKAYLLNGSSVYLSPQPFNRVIFMAGGYYAYQESENTNTLSTTDRTVFTINGVEQPLYGSGEAHYQNRSGLFGYYDLPANNPVTVDAYTWHEQRHWDHRVNEPYLILVFKN